MGGWKRRKRNLAPPVDTAVSLYAVPAVGMAHSKGERARLEKFTSTVYSTVAGINTACTSVS
jgi:hypothetical protein